MRVSHRDQVPDLSSRQMFYFMMLAEHGSISKAAHAAGVAQPSLSEHIARLEGRLNCKLAIRGPRGVTLTEAGRLLADEGVKLIDIARNLASGVREVSERLHGMVSIGLPPSLSQLVSIPLAETLRIEMPEIKLHLAEGLSGHVMEWIDQERVDFGFIYSAPSSMDYLSTLVLEEEIFLIAAEDNLPVPQNADGSYSISAAQLAGLPLAIPGLPHSARIAIDRFAKANGLDLDVIVELDSLSQILNMVGRASAFTMLPHAPVAEAIAQGSLVKVRITDPGFLRGVYLTRKLSHPASMISLKVEQVLLQIIGEMTDRYDLKVSYPPEKLALSA